jgi:hypothetical protein
MKKQEIHHRLLNAALLGLVADLLAVGSYLIWGAP